MKAIQKFRTAGSMTGNPWNQRIITIESGPIVEIWPDESVAFTQEGNTKTLVEIPKSPIFNPEFKSSPEAEVEEYIERLRYHALIA